ncbi:MAG TPA: sensor domain-containing diguanylate cyclase [Methylophaga sp.]|jgi:diguanylate cyclase (GGDEF)-like protein/PAS domain S-box-containing protein|uniref:GGDEF domain-containing protein n=1 Tax=unclassified Methylophaga TaxID=2629249 RepID=UPI000C976F64|nr:MULTISPECIES: sensor domain-containing diguanylate cyclase [unclassified Methylophaga]MAP27139.1 sensor domain-containing diguanylate cyclase [Methylophaga sp.]HAD32078.1 sensor domain-containing diguanylate cyclase [Methylophaga sp.]HBX61454.1 sensor domain-containing diguanylate cyclase [Methylophaga sp.]HCO01571.1 sensor domain-containing diguanylate cyclase [Methylophaga sp.]|tara:strand:+ start:45174 stop:46112 length:939 start_codon:yes stop_codon:yes gene_type:complete
MTDLINNVPTENDVYKTLLESTKAIPWKLDWASMQFTYIGPQIEALLGWEPSSWKSVEDWAARMHEDERQWVVDYCVSQSKSGIDHEADYRALTKDGNYVWIRDVVHVVRKENGEVESLIGFMFDISERKKTEQELIKLQKELEELSFKDGLTGVANRRMFDSVIETEWLKARQNKQPLSLIIIDIDFFKEYNDFYGHLQGDDCLKQVAETLNNVKARSRDFFGRFGGEEFIMLLPEADENAAWSIAERCRQALFKKQIPHEQSKVSQLLTISLGVSTMIPSHDDEHNELISRADKQLYQAKHKGRNCIQSA